MSTEIIIFKKYMTKLNKVLLCVVLALLIVLGFLIWKPNFFGSLLSSNYYAVYLASGDLYFGKMAWYNHNVLTDVRMIQSQQEDKKAQPTLSLVEFSKGVVWGPVESLKLNERNIVWISKLSEESQVMQLIKGNATAKQ